jgi:hypothetical protein
MSEIRASISSQHGFTSSVLDGESFFPIYNEDGDEITFTQGYVHYRSSLDTISAIKVEGCGIPLEVGEYYLKVTKEDGVVVSAEVVPAPDSESEEEEPPEGTTILLYLIGDFRENGEWLVALEFAAA